MYKKITRKERQIVKANLFLSYEMALIEYFQIFSQKSLFKVSFFSYNQIVFLKGEYYEKETISQITTTISTVF